MAFQVCDQLYTYLIVHLKKKKTLKKLKKKKDISLLIHCSKATILLLESLIEIVAK